MPLDHEHIITNIAARLETATTAQQACQIAMVTLGEHVPATIAVLLRVRNRLRCVAATGSWHVFSSLPLGTGVIGRVYASGQTETVTDVGSDPDYLPLVPGVMVEVCAPITNVTGQPIGVLNLEWTAPVETPRWHRTVDRVAALIGARIGQLGGLPAENHSEKLLRHAIALTNAATEWELLKAAIDAVRDVSDLPAAVLVLAGPRGLWVSLPTTVPGELEARIRQRLGAAGQPALERLMEVTYRQGASYTLGETECPPIPGYDLVVEAGVRTLIAVPAGPRDTGGVLLVADERTLRPDPTTVNLMELFAAQAWACLDRLRSLSLLHEQASSDPLTGLRHHGSFGERIAAATPGRTALLAIDIDKFKTINDTYGHQVGDQVLVGLARTLEDALRQGDELYRIGGDEFVAVLEVVQPQEALGIAERLATAARRIGRTISIGVALQRPNESPKQTLHRADTALYDVKRAGGDAARLHPT